MLEAEVHDGNTDIFEDDLSYTEKIDFIRCYMRVSNGLLHIFSEHEISELLATGRHLNLVDRRPGLNSQQVDLACLYLMIAIGCQCRGRDQMDLLRAKKYFVRAQQMAFADMLHNPSLGIVRVFLLMAMYMLGACRRNTAFMYIGVASKAATILGLHIPYQRTQVSVEQRATRRRIWMSLRVMDLLCSSILARPSSTPSIQRDEYETDTISTESIDHRTLAISANYESSSIIDAIVQKFAVSSILDAESTENFLQMLNEWSQALPAALRTVPSNHNSNQSTQTGADPDEPFVVSACPIEIAVGNIHVACTYYFGMILVTRQHLVLRVMSQLNDRKSGTGTEKKNSVGTAASAEEESLPLSNACTSAATYLIQLCHEASRGGILLDNMCILKAWLFSAGLVLGFALLSEEENWSINHEAFIRAQEILHKLARLSSQAQQYYDILTSFSNAIDLYRQQLLTEKKLRAATNPYVERIMSIGTPPCKLSGRDEEYSIGLAGTKYPPQRMQTPKESANAAVPAGLLEDLTSPEQEFQFLFDGFEGTSGDDIGLQLLWDSYATQFPRLVSSGDSSDASHLVS